MDKEIAKKYTICNMYDFEEKQCKDCTVVATYDCRLISSPYKKFIQTLRQLKLIKYYYRKNCKINTKW